MNLLEKWKNSVDKGKSFGALLADLSKAFDCLDHELLTAKLNAYGFTLPALRLIHDYLSNKNKEQRLMIIIVFGQKYYFAFHKSQFLIHFFLIFPWRISFFEVKDIDIASYANDSTLFIMENNIDNVIASLKQVSDALFNWFKNNLLKNNGDQ